MKRVSRIYQKWLDLGGSVVTETFERSQTEKDHMAPLTTWSQCASLCGDDLVKVTELFASKVVKRLRCCYLNNFVLNCKFCCRSIRFSNMTIFIQDCCKFNQVSPGKKNRDGARPATWPHSLWKQQWRNFVCHWSICSTSNVGVSKLGNVGLGFILGKTRKAHNLWDLGRPMCWTNFLADKLMRIHWISYAFASIIWLLNA